MAYVAPTWVNGQSPALDAETLNAICQALARLPMENGGTFATSGAAGLYNLINAAATLTSSTLASGDYVGIKDVSAGTGKQVTLSNLASWIGSNGTGAKIATGSYTGTGTYGSSNPNSISFPFTPKFAMIYAFGTALSGGMMYTTLENRSTPFFIFSIITSSYQANPPYFDNGGTSPAYGSMVKKSGNTVYWYSTSAYYQYNNQNVTFFWIAFS